MQICFFLEELQQVFFCGTSYSIETLMRILLKPQKKISSVWIFLKVGGKFRFVGKFGNNQHWWCLTNQPAIVRPIYAERGTISKSWQGHNKTQGNIHSQLERQEFIKEKNVFFFEANLLYFEPGITFRLCLLIKKWLQVVLLSLIFKHFLFALPPQCYTYKIEICL